MTTLVHLEPGTIFARDFRVIRPLSAGGMGAVYVAEQISTGKERAVKIMHPQLVADPKARERFAQEARIGGQIKSDHIVEVVGAGIDESTGTPWLAMELLEGEDLAAVVRKRGALPPSEVLEIFEQLGDALGKAHALGIVHRDLKPENLFIAVSRRRGVPFTVKILDFGIAKLAAENKTAATVTSAIGSPLWMAPEQAHRGAKVRPSTDVWALGLIAFYLLTGRYYWHGANVPGDEFNLSALLSEVLVLPLEPATVRGAALGCGGEFDRGFDAWFARCVGREPEQRWRDAAEAVSALPLAAGIGAPVLVAPASAPGTAPPPSLNVTAHPSASPQVPLGLGVTQVAQPPPRAVGGRTEVMTGPSPGDAALAPMAGGSRRPPVLVWGVPLVIVCGVLAAIGFVRHRIASRGRGTSPAASRPGGTGHAPRAPTVPPASANPRLPPKALAIVAGGYGPDRGGHTCARMDDGTVRCWGFNDRGQLGDGTTEDRFRPTVVAGLGGVAQLAVNRARSCARMDDGTVRCWGVIDGGQYRDGLTTERHVPTPIAGLVGIAQLIVGPGHTCARTANGSTSCWGWNSGGFGDGTMTRHSPSPVVVPGLDHAAELALGSGYSCERMADGAVHCWGLVFGESTPHLLPTRVPRLADAIQVGVGYQHACALIRNGTVWCWGYNYFGTLGDGRGIYVSSDRATPAPVESPSAFVQIALGHNFTCGRLADGTVSCWGSNEFGQLGDGTTVHRSAPTPVVGLADVAEVAVGGGHACARLVDGTVRCWGSNFHGYLGDGTRDDRLTPTPVAF